MSFIYNKRKTEFLNGAGIDMNSDDIRVLLVMANTVLDTEDDVNTFGDLTGGAATGSDEMDGANYTTKGKVLASLEVNEDLPNNRAEFDAADVVWTALGAGTRQVVGAVVYKHITNLAASKPIAYLDSGGFPFTATGNNFTLQWNAEGIFQAR